MTDAEYIRRLEQENLSLMLLLGMAIRALPSPRRRVPGDAPSAYYWPDSVIDRILADIDRTEYDGGGGA